MKTVWRWTVLILVGVLFGWACNRQSTLPSAPPDATGIVELIQEPNNAGLLQILVQGDQSLASGKLARVWVTIGEDTEIVHAKTARKIPYSELKEGQRVQVWFSGGVRLSDPGQAYGRVIVVTD